MWIGHNWQLAHDVGVDLKIPATENDLQNGYQSLQTLYHDSPASERHDVSHDLSMYANSSPLHVPDNGNFADSY